MAYNPLSDSFLGSKINGAATATPNDTDYVATSDSSVLKKITWSSIKTFLRSYFDAYYTSRFIRTNRQTNSYTLVLGDADYLIEMDRATANILTIPNNSSVAFQNGTQVLVTQRGVGQTSIAPDSGVTIRSVGGKLKLTAQYSAATLIKIDTNEWYLFGDIAS